MLATCAAGAGYGPPWERAPQRVLHDLAEGWVSAEQAAEVYGVIVRDGALDAEATSARRRELAAQSPPVPELLDVEHRSREIADRLAPYVLAPVPRP